MQKTILLFFLTSVQVMLLSCAVAVSFNVEHPPLVDLRNVNSITVIPFEWNRNRGYPRLAANVTSALVNGIRKENLNYVSPHVLEHLSVHDYRNHVDVYITGRIINVGVSDNVQTREENRYNETVTMTNTTRSVTVEIEYTYIRAVNQEILGYFRKSETRSASSGYTRHAYPPQRPNRVTRGDRQEPRHDPWTNSIAASAIAQFSNTMSQELSPWTSTERRFLRGRSAGGDSAMTEAKRMIRQTYYGRAFDMYTEIFERTGNFSAGFNLAVLLQLDEQFPAALALLEELRKRSAASGRRTPGFIAREINRITEFINGFTILEGYQ